MSERKTSESGPASLSEEQIVTSRVARRAFLTTVGLGSAAIAAAALTNACSSADKCDADLIKADSDPTDRVRPGDRCDSDGTR